MKKIAILMVLMLGLLALAGCSSDNESKMVDYTLTTTVTDEATGDPIEGATVSVDGKEETTDANGIAQLELSYGDHTVFVSAEGYVNGSAPVEISSSDENLDIKLSEGETIKAYIYSSTTGTQDAAIKPGIVDWDTGSTLTEITDEPNYDNVYKVVSGSGWGEPAACIAFESLATGFTDSYDTLNFKVYSANGRNDISVKFDKMDGSAGHELVFDYATYGTAVSDTSNDWYEMSIPLSDFNDYGNGVYEQFGIHSGYGNADTIYVTDIYFE